MRVDRRVLLFCGSQQLMAELRFLLHVRTRHHVIATADVEQASRLLRAHRLEFAEGVDVALVVRGTGSAQVLKAARTVPSVEAIRSSERRRTSKANRLLEERDRVQLLEALRTLTVRQRGPRREPSTDKLAA